MGQVRIAPETFLDGQYKAPSLDSQGRMRAVVEGISGGGDASAANQLTQITAEQAIQTAVESIDTKTSADQATETTLALIEDSSAITAQFQTPPSYYKNYASIPVGGIDLTTVYPGKTCVKIETYGDGVISTKPLGDPSTPVTNDTYYGWTWFQCSATIEDTTTALPLKVYWC